MLAAAGKNRIVTLDIPGKPWIRRSWRTNWSAGSRMVVMSVC